MPRPTPRSYDLEHLFGQHRPKDKDLAKYEAVRVAAMVFAETILENVPPGPDQDDAIRHVRKAVMMGNAAIALEGSILKSEVLISQLLNRVLNPGRVRGTVVQAIHMCKADAAKLHGHARFVREIDSDLLRKGIIGHVEGAAIVVSTGIDEGTVRVVERGAVDSGSPVALAVT